MGADAGQILIVIRPALVGNQGHSVLL